VAEGSGGPSWPEVISALTQGYPDIDPTDALKPLMQKYRVSYNYFDKLAQQQGYKDVFDAYAEFEELPTTGPTMSKGVAEGKGLAKKVKVVKGEHAGKTGWIREIKHGAHKGAPKTYYIDLDDGGQANNLPATALRLVKDQGVSEAYGRPPERIDIPTSLVIPPYRIDFDITTRIATITQRGTEIKKIAIPKTIIGDNYRNYILRVIEKIEDEKYGDDIEDRDVSLPIREDDEANKQFDMIEAMVSELASLNQIDEDVIWEMYDDMDDQSLLNEAEAWQTSKGKNKNGGLNKKGVDSYRRSHPGSKLQTAVTTKPSKLKKGSKAAKRRKSFCARMKGMKKHRAGAKTKRDPNSRINKALRKWHCEGVENLERALAEAIKKDKELKPGQYYIWKIYFDDGTNKTIKVTKDNFDPKAYYAKKNKTVVNVDYSWEPHNEDQQ